MATQRQTLFGDAYLRCPACASWMPNRASACTECGYQPALGKTTPVTGYTAVRVLTGALVVLVLGFSVAYARRGLPPQVESIPVEAMPEIGEPASPPDTSSNLANAPVEIEDVRSRSYAHQFVIDYMETHIPVAEIGDEVTVYNADKTDTEVLLFIQVLKYSILVETPDGGEREVPLYELPADTRIRCDMSYRRQHQRRETERLWKLRNKDKDAK